MIYAICIGIPFSFKHVSIDGSTEIQYFELAQELQKEKKGNCELSKHGRAKFQSTFYFVSIILFKV